MQVDIQLLLPRDNASVPVVRHLCARALHELGVDAACSDDVEIAVSEACTNVLKHSGPGDEYSVAIEIDPGSCVIRVVDTGHGFDFSSLADAAIAETAEGGRGVILMHALVDRVQFVSRPQDGTVVHLEKELTYDRSSPFADRD